MIPTETAAQPSAPPRGIDLPCEDGIPLETPWHCDAMNLLLDNIAYHRRGRDDYFAGGNMFFYYSTRQLRTNDFRGPDVFVVNGADRTRRRASWVVWEEDGRVPSVIVELMSESTRQTDLVAKRELYTRTLNVPEYFCVDPTDRRVIGWRRYRASVEPIEDEGGRLWCSELEAYIGWWEGVYRDPPGDWYPRLFDVRGTLVPTEREAAGADALAQSRRAETAEAELARLRAELQALRNDTTPPA